MAKGIIDVTTEEQRLYGWWEGDQWLINLSGLNSLLKRRAEQAAGATETPLGTPTGLPVGPRTPEAMTEPEDGERTTRCLNPLCGCGNRIPSEYPRNQCERDYGTCSVECALVYYGEEDVEFSDE